MRACTQRRPLNVNHDAACVIEKTGGEVEIGAHCLKVGGKRNGIVILTDKFLAARLASIIIHKYYCSRPALACCQCVITVRHWPHAVAYSTQPHPARLAPPLAVPRASFKNNAHM